ncbi:hypothetical protein [Clostridium sp.]|uniref:hypothetical protein n=1 Tax=Clostridium sp. TaxID=1506 RepID=UPI003D6D31D8
MAPFFWKIENAKLKVIIESSNIEITKHKVKIECNNTEDEDDELSKMLNDIKIAIM